MRLKQRAAQLTLLPEARLASPPAWQDDGREVLTCDGSGLSFSASAGRLVPAGSWQRTLSESLASSLRGLTGCAVSLRLRATKCGRSLLVPTMLERPTEGSESGSSRDVWNTPCVADTRPGRDPETLDVRGHWGAQKNTGNLRDDVQKLWPTARAEDSESAGTHVARGTAETLTAAARLWPTATSNASQMVEGDALTPESERQVKRGQVSLATVVALTDAANGLWAPQARDWKDSGPTQGARHSFNLGSQIAAGRLAPDSPSTSGKRRGWPTPNALDGTEMKSGVTPEDHDKRDQAKREANPNLNELQRALGVEAQRESGARGLLNPAWVSQLMGFPTGWLAASPPVTGGRRLKPLGIRSCPSVPRSSAKRSSTRKRG